MLFADVRGYTSLAEHQAPGETARLMNRFYAVATQVLAHHDAVIDKLVGDKVMALVPEMDRDVTGLPMIEKLAAIMFV